MLFDAVSNLDAIRSASSAPVPVGFSALYRYATDPDSEPDTGLLNSLAGDACVKRDFDALLRRVSSVSFLRVAAAASEREIDDRTVSGWRIRIRRVQANPAQVWVILDHAEQKAELPRILFVGSLRQPLPDPRDGRFQFRLDADSELVKGLRDMNSEIFLV